MLYIVSLAEQKTKLIRLVNATSEISVKHLFRIFDEFASVFLCYSVATNVDGGIKEELV